MKKQLVKTSFWVLGIAAFAMPFAALAQSGDVGGALITVSQLVSMAIPIVVGLIILVILCGGVKALASKDPEKRKDSIKIVITGIIFLALFVSIWGIVRVIQKTFPDLDTNTPVQLPSSDGIPLPNQNL